MNFTEYIYNFRMLRVVTKKTDMNISFLTSRSRYSVELCRGKI